MVAAIDVGLHQNGVSNAQGSEQGDVIVDRHIGWKICAVRRAILGPGRIRVAVAGTKDMGVRIARTFRQWPPRSSRRWRPSAAQRRVAHARCQS